jgi:hypothetical protein
VSRRKIEGDFHVLNPLGNPAIRLEYFFRAQ